MHSALQFGSLTGKHELTVRCKNLTFHSGSALGGDDGLVYEALWSRAQQEPLNETDVPDGYSVWTLTVLHFLWLILMLSGIHKANACKRTKAGWSPRRKS